MGRPPLDYIRTHVSIEPEALARLDKLVGPKGRAEFIRRALNHALDMAEHGRRSAEAQKKTAQ